jgi:hypothetical protein
VNGDIIQRSVLSSVIRCVLVSLAQGAVEVTEEAMMKMIIYLSL